MRHQVGRCALGIRRRLMDTAKKPAATIQRATPRRPYSTPRLVRHGTVANITAGLPQGGLGYVTPTPP
jgi:hypothetical protein